MKMISDTETLVQSWYHHHFLTNNRREKYLNQSNDWFVKINSALQHQLQLHMERMNLHLDEKKDRVTIRGPREFGGQNVKNILMKAKQVERFGIYGTLKKDIEYGTPFSAEKELPQPPLRKDTKRMKFISSKSNSSIESLEPNLQKKNEPESKEEKSSDDSAKEIFCNIDGGIVSDITEENVRTVKAKNPPPEPPPRHSKWKQLSIPKVVITKENQRNRAISKLKDIVDEMQNWEKRPIESNQPERTIHLAQPEGSKLRYRDSLTTTTVERPIEEKRKSLCIIVPQFPRNQKAGIAETFPLVLLPGMMPDNESYISSGYESVSGYTLLYFILHLFLILSVVTGTNPVLVILNKY
jgi:hypothetical protein